MVDSSDEHPRSKPGRHGSAPPELVVFSPGDQGKFAEVVARMDELAAGGRGWVNVEPVIPPEVPVPPTPGALAIFHKQGPAVPMATWTVPRLADRGVEVAEVGVSHGLGSRIRGRLVSHGHTTPEGWQLVQDHPRRGLVLRLEGNGDPGTVLRWVVPVLEDLCRLPTDGTVAVMFYPG